MRAGGGAHRSIVAPGHEDSFITNIKSGEKIFLIEENGQYIMEASLETGLPF